MKRLILNLVLISALFMFLSSCSMDDLEEEIPEPIPDAPTLVASTVISDKEINFEFTSPVKVAFLSFYPFLTVDSVEDGSTVIVHLKQNLEPGDQIVASLFAADEWGNWVSVLVPLEVLDIENPDTPSTNPGSNPGNNPGINPGSDPDPEPDPVYQVSQLIGYNIISETMIEFEFTSPVKVDTLFFNHELGYEWEEDERIIRVLFEEELEPGINITAELLAEDEWGNEINEEIAFYTLNNRVPQLLINEIRTLYSGSSNPPRAEFIEFKMLSEGNLGALQVFITSNTKNPMIYQFPSIEVEEGEYVVLHLRKLNPLSVDELKDNLAESFGADSSMDARDLWVNGTSSILNNTNDAVYVMDQEENVLSAIMFSNSPDAWWRQNHLAEAAEFLHSKNAWTSPLGEVCTPIDAVRSNSIGSAMTRSISRDENIENTNTAEDWFVTGNNGVTPGLPNIERK